MIDDKAEMDRVETAVRVTQMCRTILISAADEPINLFKYLALLNTMVIEDIAKRDNFDAVVDILCNDVKAAHAEMGALRGLNIKPEEV